MTDTVLVVEDDADVRETTRLVLERRGFAVHTARDGAEGYEMAMRLRPDVAVVDVAMPHVDGLSLTRALVAAGGCPVLLLTARDLPDDQVTGFEAGAFDYVTKPFDSRVLAARLRALIGRTCAPTGVERYGPLTVDRDAQIVWRDGVEITLSPTELRLLWLLLDNCGIVLTRSTILAEVWGRSGWADDHLVDVNVQRLRARIGPDLITTVRGTGYRVDAS
ncbi:DNA-binding response regulator [Brachybacterium alimentarium]|uniref:response regulator transcription factor n=1 Tax=Brachybacterium alimentarium TaxID=47845 RepID=UPI000DF126E9|nr:response regulator transcription factor [Brachybacterium alimentarium]RCS93541.1 DNA-binding response regulator [Brachybacterium alimentarium]